MPAKSMTRREFVGLLVASVAAMIAGAAVWRAFRHAILQGGQEAVHGVITAIDHVNGTITIDWGLPGPFDVRNNTMTLNQSLYGTSGFHVGEPVALLR